MDKLTVAIMGATGAVGQEMLRTLEERHFPCTTLKLLASERSVGKKFPFRGRLHPVELLTADSFSGVDIVLASAGGSISKEFAPKAAAAMVPIAYSTVLMPASSAASTQARAQTR